MRKNKTLLLLIFFIPLLSFAQKRSRFSVEINYGLNGNFFVQEYNEKYGSLDKRKFLGTAGGGDIKYSINKRSAISFGFSRTIHKTELVISQPIYDISLEYGNFQLRSMSNYFQAAYERDFSERLPDLRFQAGVFICNAAGTNDFIQ